MEFIPFARPGIGDDEINEVIDTLKSGWLTTGPKTKLFEANFCDFVEAKHALAVNSATAGLHLGLEALGAGPGDKVITTVHTFTATAAVIRFLGATPVFADIDPESYNICPHHVERLLQEHDVKVVIPVHYAGQACDMDSLLQLRNKYGFKILEDAAHALPTTYNGQLVGSIGDVTVFSFYANKTITTGEGGMVTTNIDEIAERIKIMRLHGINKDAFDRFHTKKPSWHYEIVAPGFKYNLTDLASAIGIHQLKRAYDYQSARQRIADAYNENFADLPVICPRPINPEDMHSWHLYVLQLETERLKISRDEFIEILAEKGIGTSVHYIPLHQQPSWKNSFGLTDEQFPISTKVSARHVSLPNFPGMTAAEIYYVVENVSRVLQDATIDG